MEQPAGRALAWRLHRHALERSDEALSAVEVVRRVLAVRGWPLEAAELAVCVRQTVPDGGGLQVALDSGAMVCSYAFRGGSYVFPPEIAALVLSVRTVTRVWETRRWQEQGGFLLEDWEALREAVVDALVDGPLTREELSGRLAETPLSHLSAAAMGRGADSLYKPLHWWGDICFGPQRGGRSTFRLLRGDPAWPGLPQVDDAGRELVRCYLGSYGPATQANLHYWFTEGLGVPRRRLHGWLRDLGDDIATEGDDGRPTMVLREDLESFRAAGPSTAVRLLPAFDPWILGPGTADDRLIHPTRRSLFSQGASPVIRGGVVVGTWRRRGSTVEVSVFPEAGVVAVSELEGEVQRLAAAGPETLTVLTSSHERSRTPRP